MDNGVLQQYEVHGILYLDYNRKGSVNVLIVIVII